jgi:glyoxylase-like metal-dependent hydrolase (beta-lactamase superfamily II)
MNAMAAAKGDARMLCAQVYTSPFLSFESTKGTFSPTTSTLLLGSAEAVLIDAQHIRTDVVALGELIAQSRRRLTAIYITHGHADHWYGIGELLTRFPGAQAFATQGVVDYITESAEVADQQWAAMFGERVVDHTVVPAVLAQPELQLEEAEIRIIEVGQGDIAPSTVVHVPAIDTVVSGDVVYNKIHAMLGFGGPAEWQRWIASVDAIERLAPKTVVAGHKRPDCSDTDVDRMLDETRSYISDFADVAGTVGTAEELVGAMKAKYPDFGNPWTLHFSARSWFSRNPS